MRILITGSRNWTDFTVVREALKEAVGSTPPHLVTIVEGGASGADAIAAYWAQVLGWNVQTFRADWQNHGRRAGPKRNAHMVAVGADVCLAFPLADSIGTFDCMRRAEARGIKVINYGCQR